MQKIKYNVVEYVSVGRVDKAVMEKASNLTPTK